MNARLPLLTLVLATTAQVQAVPCGDLRLTPAELADSPTVGAGAGTSGVSGIRTTVLCGDPAAAGSYAIALRVPARTRIAAHRHRDQRTAVVAEGTWYFGYGEPASESAEKALGPGSVYAEPAERPHFARTGDAAVTVYIFGVGPTDTRYAE